MYFPCLTKQQQQEQDYIMYQYRQALNNLLYEKDNLVYDEEMYVWFIYDVDGTHIM